MIRSDESWLELAGSFHAAALGDNSWENALERFASATGSRTGQLTGIQTDSSVIFNTLTNIDPTIYKIFAETAEINPRVLAANTAPVLKVLSDWEIMTPDAYRRDRYCQEVLQPFDIPFICMTTLVRTNEAFVALAAVRSKREGEIKPEQHKVFATIAPHVRAAVRTHMAMQGQGVAVLTQAMETLSIPVFVCDRTGRIIGLTPSAEALVAKGSALQLKGGKLRASQPGDQRMLEHAIGAAAISYLTPGPPACRALIIHKGHADRAPVVIDVLPLPAGLHTRGLVSIEPRVLVFVRGSGGASARKAAMLRAAYGLSSSEAEIATSLAEGKTAELIAIRRGVRVGTVRAQIKSILAKVGVRRQIELAAWINQM